MENFKDFISNIEESKNENEVYIEYLNKEKKYKKDIISFKSYEEAVEWGKKHFDKFNSDMIKYY